MAKGAGDEESEDFMSDMMSGASSGGPGLGMAGGLLSFFNQNAANKNQRALNATASKWAPLLALNKSQGAYGVKAAPSASLAGDLYSGLLAGMASGQSSGGGGSSGGSGDTSASMNQISPNTITPSGGGMDPTGGGFGAGLASVPMDLATGGKIPKFDNGGTAGGLGSIMSLLPMLAMLAADGGKVPGKGPYPGDNPKNDLHPALLSAGEGIVPKSVMANPKQKVASYLNEINKHGPGPLPPKFGASSQSSQKPKSLSPWGAMCGGGKV